ncbi:MAG: hypothetical protein ACFB9N_14335 [Geitlerinemataceae cyanobacterium]
MTPHETTFAKLQQLPASMLPTVDRFLDSLLDSVEDPEATAPADVNQPDIRDLLRWIEEVENLEIDPQGVARAREHEDEFGEALVEKYRKLGLDL